MKPINLLPFFDEVKSDLQKEFKFKKVEYGLFYGDRIVYLFETKDGAECELEIYLTFINTPLSEGNMTWEELKHYVTSKAVSAAYKNIISKR